MWRPYILLSSTNLLVNLIPGLYDSSVPVNLHNGHMRNSRCTRNRPLTLFICHKQRFQGEHLSAMHAYWQTCCGQTDGQITEKWSHCVSLHCRWNKVLKKYKISHLWHRCHHFDGCWRGAFWSLKLFCGWFYCLSIYLSVLGVQQTL